MTPAGLPREVPWPRRGQSERFLRAAGSGQGAEPGLGVPCAFLRPHFPSQQSLLPSERTACAALGHSVVSDSFPTLWTVARQAPLPMGILQERALEWAAMPSAGHLRDPGIEPRSSPTLHVDSLPSEPPGNPERTPYCYIIIYLLNSFLFG